MRMFECKSVKCYFEEIRIFLREYNLIEQKGDKVYYSQVFNTPENYERFQTFFKELSLMVTTDNEVRPLNSRLGSFLITNRK